MARTRLILVEGLPGSGKSTTAETVCRESVIAGTVEVLRARRALEEEILKGLDCPVHKLDNSAYDQKEREDRLKRILET